MYALYSRTASLYRIRSTAMRFSVPASSSEARELLVGLEIGIALGDGEESPEGARELVGGLDPLLARAAGDQPRPRVGDPVEDLALVRGVALGHLDEVGDQVVAPLELVLHLRPRRVDALLEGHDGVVAAAAEQRRQEDQKPRHVSSSPAPSGAAAAEAAAAEAPEAAPAAAEAAPEAAEGADGVEAAAPEAGRAG